MFISNGSDELKNISNIKVKDVMSVPAVLEEDSSIHDAMITLFLKDAGTIFITNNRYLSGVVSRKDLLKACVGGGDIYDIPVAMVMTRMPNVIYITPEDTVGDASLLLIDHEVDSLPVIIPENGKDKLKVVGRFSKTTIARLFVEELKK